MLYVPSIYVRIIIYMYILQYLQLQIHVYVYVVIIITFYVVQKTCVCIIVFFPRKYGCDDAVCFLRRITKNRTLYLYYICVHLPL